MYQYVFYLEEIRSRVPAATSLQWRPLEKLWSGVVADVEDTIVSQAWEKLEAELGFRPIALDPERRGNQKG